MGKGVCEIIMYYTHIPISKINDFEFCPYSLYFHSVYESFEGARYKARAQISGKLAHKAVDEQRFSDRKHLWQNAEVFSQKYGLIGKIDIYNSRTKVLTERKKKIRKIYRGYIWQLLAEKLCLEEMGFPVKKMALYSKDDNKTYPVTVSADDMRKFEKILKQIRNFDFSQKYKISPQKCLRCIYKELCNKRV